MKLFSQSSRLTIVALALLVTVLAACGDNTSTPVVAPATTAAATTAAATTAAAPATTAATATTVAATTAAATTAATATTAAVATTAAAGTSAATTAAGDTSAATTAAATSGTGTGTSTGAADIPVYSGATEVTLPAAITSQFASSVGSSVKNAKVQAYKVSDSADAVSTFFKDGFKSAGWTDLSAQIPASSTAALSGTGLSLIGPYAKAPNVAVVMVGPGSLFATAGVTDVTASDTVYLVFQGNA